MTRILVTGSRTWTDDVVIARALREASEEITGNDEAIVVVHGGAPGADRIADRVARLNMWDIERHPADWDRWGKRAGFIRNQEMVDLGADICLAFIRHSSQGATHTASIAEQAGIPTRRYSA